MVDLSLHGMPTTKEFKRKSFALGDRIRQRMDLLKPTDTDLERAGYKRGAIEKIQNGINVTKYVQFGELAEALGTTPDYLLGFLQKGEREAEELEAVIGLIQGVALALGRPLEEAAPLAESVAAKLNSRAIRNSYTRKRDSASTLALAAVEEFLLPKKP